MIMCRKCHRWVYPDEMVGSICKDCDEEEYERLVEQNRNQIALKEQAERHHQEMLDAVLPWLTCDNCGKSVRKDHIVKDGDRIYCGDCSEQIRECQFCHKHWVTQEKHRTKVFYVRNENFSKKSNEIEYGERDGLEPNTNIDPFTNPLRNLAKSLSDFKISHKERSMSYKFYDDIRRFCFYMCPSCYEKSQELPEQWDESHKLKEKYNQLKATKEKNDRLKEELEGRKKELAKLNEEIRIRKKKQEEKERKEKTLQTFSGICFGLVLLVACLVIGYMSDQMTTTAIVGILLCIVSYLLRSITSSLFMGLIYGICIGLAFGLPIAIVSWFVWDTFLMPLIIVALVGMVVGTILDKMGVFDSKS